MPCSSIRVAATSGAGRSAPQMRARVVAEVTDEGALVGVGMAAAAAVLGVEGVLQLGQRLRGVVDPEVDDALAPPALAVASEIGDQGVVGVEDEATAAGPLADRLRPAIGQGLGLAVAVELVAEEVAEDDRRGVELRRDLRQPGLVDLEQALVAALLEQRGGDPPGHVRAGAVVDRPAAGGGEQRREHRRGRRLAVGRADQGRAAVEAGAEAGDRPRLEAQQHPPGQGRAAAAPAGPAGGADRPRGEALGPEQRPAAALAHSPARGGTITLSAWGSTRSLAGRSVRCSPSA